jgi:leucyl-tRNA synthetase
MEAEYKPKEIESRWQKCWEERKLFKVKPDPGKPKYYVLEMFPYPSGRIHMGHVRNYSIGDLVARVKRMEGHNVLYPMGWDAFGMPAENAALAAKVHPREWTYQNIDTMRSQLKRMGFSYDWDRELATCDPEYYRWEQDVFLRMHEKGLVYRKASFVNWCHSCRTVLANEQVEGGGCWRCGNQVVQKELEQWVFKITEYVEDLLSSLDDLKGRWPDQVLTMQRNWIGKSHGARLTFKLEKAVAGHEKIDSFTTRPDTLFGATFFSLAAEHPLALELARGTEREKEVAEFVHRVRGEDKIKRSSEDYVKEGCDTGARVINPVNGESIPVFIANFVLMEYGTGAIMAVPAHDQRDFEFAKRYNIPIRVVINPPGENLSAETMTEAYEAAGTMVNSGPFDGVDSEKGKAAVVEHLKKRGDADFTVHYRLRDWGISRQRYWGAPIPMVHCPDCGIVPVPKEQLPVTLPEDVVIDYEGGSPLAKHPTWSKTRCPKCDAEARRETDTMDTFVESSWYFFRYCSPRFASGVFDREETGY